MRAVLFPLTLWSIGLLCLAAPAQDVIYAASEVTGDIVQMDPATGDRTLIASTVGPFRGIAIEPTGDIVATLDFNSFFSERVIRVTPSTGSVEILSWGGVVGAGPPLLQPRHISVDLDGSLLVSDFGLTGLFRVDPLTGDRTVISSNQFASPEVGTGPTITYWRNTEVEAGGDYVAGDFASNSVYRINSITGDRSLVSGMGTGTGPGFTDARSGLVVRDDSQILVTEYDSPAAVLSVSPISGNRAVITSGGVGSGEDMSGQPRDIDYLSDGRILVAVSYDELAFPGSPSSAAIFAVDPATGDREVFSSASVGIGPIPADGFQHIAVKRATVPAGMTVFEEN